MVATSNQVYHCPSLAGRFAAVSSRVELRETLRRCTMVAFGRYSQELEEIQHNYEQNKVCFNY